MRNTKENKPYVISADTNGLLNNWAKENNLTLPKKSYFQGMLGDLESTLGEYFDQVDVIPEKFLRQGLNKFIESSPVPVISLDRAYINPKQKNLEGFLDVTRTVDRDLNNTGLGGRALKIALEKQIKKLAMEQSGETISLVDDVIFEGATMLEIVQKLRKAGVAVDTVYSGITIKEGQDFLEENGVQTKSLVSYDQVTDEICERDFVVGAPYSGRSVNDKGSITGAPYLYPFGKPKEWASIPEDEAFNFSLFCLLQSEELWAKIEKLSNQNISTQQISKPVFGLPENKSMSDAIRNVIERLK